MKANGSGRGSLEKRVEDLEMELKEVRSELAAMQDRSGWRGFVGTHANSVLFDEVIQEIERSSAEELAAAQTEEKPKHKTRRVATSRK
ncbi:MAG: hypothetical protein H7062_19245 [Candidatus Saccharimonas sp.]|nr:hypothetical protein [Planctomycetaceae bacterium]